MMRKLLFAGLLSSAALIASSGAWAQNEGAVGSVGNITDSTSSATNQSANEVGALSSSGGNVFDFSSSSRNTPGAPPLSNFGTGPCIGAGYTAAGSGPGFSLGVGHQSIDDSCTRRA